MTGEQFLFWLLALTTCGGAIAVVVSQNVVRMAFWLVVALGSVAAIYFLLHADFVGATQLMIYVGGTIVLLIFGVMLTASGPYVKIKTSPGDMVIASGVGVLVLFLLIGTVTAVDWKQAHRSLVGNEHAEYPPAPAAGYNKSNPSSGNTARPIGLKLLGVSLEDTDPTRKDAQNLSAGYLLPFEIVSVHLLVVLIGAGYLARAKRRVPVGADAVVETLAAPVPVQVGVYAGFWRRAAAMLIDGIVISAVQVPAALLMGPLTEPPSNAFVCVSSLLIFLYLAGMESSAYQGTIGKIIMRIAVTDTYGQPVSFLRAAARTLSRYLSGFCLLFGYFMALFTKRKQTLHDLVAGTLVVRRK
ncbi:MAG: hypothetical protein HOL01_02160 [Planctomycetaceae bacterium]|jgi:NADH-quinone oxidoreductase subunit J|nr:hypothetical protein [Planctomycetaceae bacterium]MBT6486683.1 hypothetical protein [Planctomycetaceae bacterium]MBT6493332.1 hypothetical protein [Planctomycetaceae bacterium]